MNLIVLQIQEGVLIHRFCYFMESKNTLVLITYFHIKEKWEETRYLLKFRYNKFTKLNFKR